MRFRLSGVNWEGRAWQVSTPVATLAGQVDAAYPKGWKTDGTVASQGHDQTSPRSDHRPKPYVGPGIVRAVDIGVGSMSEGMGLVEPLRQSADPRIRYVIFNNAIFSSYPKPGYPPYTWRPYTGAAHKTHIHVSMLAAADSDGQPFNIGVGTMSAIPVIEHQKALNEAGITDFEGKPLVEDDEYGPRTYSALVKAYKSSPTVETVEVVKAIL